MLKLDNICFKDDETGKTIQVHFNGNGHIVSSDEPVSVDEFAFCSIHAHMMAIGGFKGVKTLAEIK